DIDGLKQMLYDVHGKIKLRGAVDLDFVGGVVSQHAKVLEDICSVFRQYTLRAQIVNLVEEILSNSRSLLAHRFDDGSNPDSSKDGLAAVQSSNRFAIHNLKGGRKYVAVSERLAAFGSAR